MNTSPYLGSPRPLDCRLLHYNRNDVVILRMENKKGGCRYGIEQNNSSKYLSDDWAIIISIHDDLRCLLTGSFHVFICCVCSIGFNTKFFPLWCSRSYFVIRGIFSLMHFNTWHFNASLTRFASKLGCLTPMKPFLRTWFSWSSLGHQSRHIRNWIMFGGIWALPSVATSYNIISDRWNFP